MRKHQSDGGGCHPVDPLQVRDRTRAAAADLELRLFIAGTPLPAAAANVLRIASKRDLDPAAALPASVVAVSVTGETGLSELLDRIAAMVAPMAGLAGEPLLTRTRHRRAIGEAADSLGAFAALPAEEVALRAEELRRAVRAIATVTGAIGVEDVLDEIFSRFCLGK